MLQKNLLSARPPICDVGFCRFFYVGNALSLAPTNSHWARVDYGLFSLFNFPKWKLSNVGQSCDGWPKLYYLELLCASEGTLSRWSRVLLQSLTSTNPHWARVVGYGPFSLWVIHKEDLCPGSGDINRLMMKISETTVWQQTLPPLIYQFLWCLLKN
jgi:hypothetical protein